MNAMKLSPAYLSKGITYWPIAIALTLPILLGSCAKIRLLTYPDNFIWLDPQDVKGTMHSMYQSLQRLDSLLEAENKAIDNSGLEHHQNDIIDELQRLEVIATSILPRSTAPTDTQRDVPVTNHLLIDQHMDDFISEIAQARFRAEANPPRYFMAGQLIGECNACHRKR